MNLYIVFFSLFSTGLFVTSTLMILTNNPIFCVLFLITSFSNVSALLFLVNLEFLPVILIVVYVGAIAVLFLFVLMTLNVKIAQTKVES